MINNLKKKKKEEKGFRNRWNGIGDKKKSLLEILNLGYH